jgi:predicted transcriptional regulator
MPLKRVARVPDDLWDVLVEIAKLHDRTPSQEVRRALEFYIKNFKEVNDRIMTDRLAEGGRPSE